MFKKNLEELTLKLSKIKVKCTGFEWQMKNSACQNSIYIDEQDIRAKKIKDEKGKLVLVYGIICPACGCFTTIPETKIPKRVKDNAKRLVA